MSIIKKRENAETETVITVIITSQHDRVSSMDGRLVKISYLHIKV